ncbi:uncharacterized protein LOC111286087 isoform X2 [Durio zibethinus]|uniref:Uncharacterized protein LOC111286087 isoform X2 n=1 Tax=Durio zibethinus TaxID=66656 RepID=A0A6P5XTR1_DURZI|nr:uncharacterized protein LOC111286087 isoform X2 [Durio zibethinus]
MASSLCFTSVCSFNTPNKPEIIIDNSFPRKVLRVNEVFQSSRSARIQSLKTKAADKNQSTKPNSIVCADCDGNVSISKLPGVKQCSQCKGTGVNTVDRYYGQLKAGGLCWLCRNVGSRDEAVQWVNCSGTIHS